MRFFKCFLQLKAAEGAQYSTEQAIKLEMELVELKSERTVMSLRVSKGCHSWKKASRPNLDPIPPRPVTLSSYSTNSFSALPAAVRPFQREPVNMLRPSCFTIEQTRLVLNWKIYRNGIVSNGVCFSCNCCYGITVDSIDNRGEKAIKGRLGRGL